MKIPRHYPIYNDISSLSLNSKSEFIYFPILNISVFPAAECKYSMQRIIILQLYLERLLLNYFTLSRLWKRG